MQSPVSARPENTTVLKQPHRKPSRTVRSLIVELLEQIGDIPPSELEVMYYERQGSPARGKPPVLAQLSESHILDAREK